MLACCGAERSRRPGNVAVTAECLLYLETQLRDMCTHLKKPAWVGRQFSKATKPSSQEIDGWVTPTKVTGEVAIACAWNPESPQKVVWG